MRSNFNPKQIMAQDTEVQYALPGTSGVPETHLPEKYNGLGYKNLIYMVIQILDFHQRWAEQSIRTPVHLVVVEEPEAHLHAQLQQVFIAKMREIISDESGLTTQLLVTTHSSAIINESRFTPIRYFRRVRASSGKHESQVRDVSQMEAEDRGTEDFLLRYMKLTHCDLFFADAVILVEGNVERLLVPSMIEKDAPSLTSKYLTILEVGGAFAHKFSPLLGLLGIPALVITDLDSVTARVKVEQKKGSSGEGASKTSGGTKCLASVAGAVTSNATLRRWHPRKEGIGELLALDVEDKLMLLGEDVPSPSRVAYQTLTDVSWRGDTMKVAGRTFEEALAFENLSWITGDVERESLSLVSPSFDLKAADLTGVINEVHSQVKKAHFKKTELALSLMMTTENWKTPTYIVEGLQWLAKVLEPLEEGKASS
ncbi:AAA family ATPase [Clavibacter tessellarius]